MQRIENRVWRHFLGAPVYTAVAALQGEMAHHQHRLGKGVQGHEGEAKVCKLYGKQWKLAAGSYFWKVNQQSKTKDMGKAAQRIFRGIGTELFECVELLT